MIESSAQAVLQRLTEDFKSKPFIPPSALTQGDLQTLTAYFWRRFPRREVVSDEERLFEVEPGTKVLGRCRWQPDRQHHATIVMWHGIESSATAAYMLATAEKAFRAGFNVVRMNIRNCGGTEHLTPTIYHAGLSADPRAVVEELIERDRLPQIFMVGFSLGGNTVLKLAGEYGENAPPQLAGVAAISPSINLRATSELIMSRRNFVYHKEFLFSLKRRLRTKEKLFPDLYDCSGLGNIRSIREFDDAYVAPAFGFADAMDYYDQASSLPLISRIRMPTLIIHAHDDPFVPFAPLREIMANGANDSGGDLSKATNPHLLLLTPEFGGHVAFLSADGRDEDRFWAENRLLDFLRMRREE
jgi:predicted alpha/beta-fold hydrolase